MASINTLSVVSNAFQVIGFAETVLRTGASVYELFDKARSASKGIAILLLELQALLAVITSVQVVLTQHATSPFVLDDGQAVPNVCAILTLIDHDFTYLRRMIHQSSCSGSNSWFSRLQNNVRWALRDGDVAEAKERLARYTQNLNTALSSTGRQNDIILRTEIQQIRLILTQAPSHAVSCLQPSSAVHTLTQGTPPRIAPRVPWRHNRRISMPACSGRDNANMASTARSPRAHQKYETVPRASAPAILEESPRMLCPMTNVYEADDGSLIIDTGVYSLEEMTKSLLLLREPVSASLKTIHNANNVLVSRDQVEQLLLILDALVSSALAASAHHIGHGHQVPLLELSAADQKISTDCSLRTIGHLKHPRMSDSIAKRPTPIYLERRTAVLDTGIGVLRAHIVSSRSDMGISSTFAGGFTYQGNASLNLTPLEVAFSSNDKINCMFLVRPLGGADVNEYHLRQMIGQIGSANTDFRKAKERILASPLSWTELSTLRREFNPDILIAWLTMRVGQARAVYVLQILASAGVIAVASRGQIAGSNWNKFKK
ncbi:hypothetical protein NX059_003561 [Plenodomus lindquistii]|nr:hypothetical protein NX059_003561 [Plenodomus lindquistii]